MNRRAGDDITKYSERFVLVENKKECLRYRQDSTSRHDLSYYVWLKAPEGLRDFSEKSLRVLVYNGGDCKNIAAPGSCLSIFLDCLACLRLR